MANQSSVVDKSLSFRSLSSAPSDPVLNEIYQDSTTGNLLKWNGSYWGQLSQLGLWSGYHDSSFAWSTTSTSFADPTVSSSGGFSEKINYDFGTVIPEVSNLPGITFTPAYIGAVYLIQANVVINNNSTVEGTLLKLTDGNITIGNAFLRNGAAASFGNLICYVPITGHYVSTSPTATIKIQVAATGGIAQLSFSGSNTIEWTLTQIR